MSEKTNIQKSYVKGFHKVKKNGKPTSRFYIQMVIGHQKVQIGYTTAQFARKWVIHYQAMGKSQVEYLGRILI